MKYLKGIAALMLLTLHGSLATPGNGVEAASPNDFYRELAKKEIGTKTDLIRAAARLRGYTGPDDSADELRYLYERDVKFRKSILAELKYPVTKGEAARVFLNAMESTADNRGLLGRFFTGSRRLAARDGMAQKILPSGSYANEYISGSELLAMLGRAVEQMDKKGNRQSDHGQ